MTSSDLSILALTDEGDDRGRSFSLPKQLLQMLPGIEGLHFTTLRSGHVRGNHYHVLRRELLMVLYTDKWSLHWDVGEQTAAPGSRDFDGAGGVLIAVPVFAAHAIRNDGGHDLQIIALTDGEYDPENPDVFRRTVVDP